MSFTEYQQLVSSLMPWFVAIIAIIMVFISITIIATNSRHVYVETKSKKKPVVKKVQGPPGPPGPPGPSCCNQKENKKQKGE